MKRDAQSGGKLVQMESSSPSQLLGKKSQEHERAHSGQLPLEKAESWDQSQHPMLKRLSPGFQHITVDQMTTDHFPHLYLSVSMFTCHIVALMSGCRAPTSLLFGL